jgi:SAM-dependent methyltransferase
MSTLIETRALEHNRKVYSALIRPVWKSKLMYDQVSKRNIAQDLIRRARLRMSGWRILDIGFGDGLILESMPRDTHLAGVEIIPAYVERARERARRQGYLSADFKVFDGEGQIPFSSGTFDLVVCSHVLEHVPDDRALLADIRRLVRPGGLALILIPINEEDYDDPNHVRKYRPEEFLGFLRRGGLEPQVHLEADRTWHCAGRYFERGLHDRWGLIGFLGSAAINIFLTAVPYGLLARTERGFPRRLRPRQFAVLARTHAGAAGS